jgi:hypothetical protein
MEQKMAADVLDRLADAQLEVGCRAFGDGSMTDYLCDLADEIKILRSAKRQFEAEIARLRAALEALHHECVEAGFDDADDYGWPAAMTGAQEALGK